MKGEENFHGTVQTFLELLPLLEAAEIYMAPIENLTTSHTMVEDIAVSDNSRRRYFRGKSPAASTSADLKAHMVSFRPMTHDDSGCVSCSWRMLSRHRE